MRPPRGSLVLSCARALVLSLLLAGCEADRPPMREAPAVGAREMPPQAGEFQAGPERPVPYVANPYEGNARAVGEGERLYTWMNCYGCHGVEGGGGIGPPFADADWIYGGDPAEIFQSIAQGRPNGMPAFGGRLPHQEIWKIVAYVRTLEVGGGGSGGSGGGQAGERATNVPGDAQ